DDAVLAMERLVAREGRVLAHSTNNPRIIAGAGTMTLEIIEQGPPLDALVVAVGGGSQAVGAMTVARELAPPLAIYGVQAAGAMGFAAVQKLRVNLAGKRVGVIFGGGNIDTATLRRVLLKEL